MLIVVGLVAMFFQQPPRPGAALVPGLQLVYASGTDTQPVWTVDSVAFGVTHGGRSECTRIVLRAGGPAAEQRLLCRAADTLLTWSARANGWTPPRPVTPGVVVVVPRAAGGSVRFEATAAACESVGAARLATIATTVVTTDSTGRAVRRLRERYAPGLATAIGGAFEVPDSTGWRVEREFGLVESRYPVGAAIPMEC